MHATKTSGGVFEMGGAVTGTETATRLRGSLDCASEVVAGKRSGSIVLVVAALAFGTPASLGQFNIELTTSPVARHTKNRKVDRYDHDVSRCCMNPLQFRPEAECHGHFLVRD